MRNELTLISLKDVEQSLSKAVYELASNVYGFCSKSKKHFVQAGGIGERVAKTAEVKIQFWVGHKSSWKIEAECSRTLSNYSQTFSRWRPTKLAKLR